jgi:hypothetical protein
VQFKAQQLLEIVNCRKILTDVKQHLDDACARPLLLWKDANKRETCNCDNNYPILNCHGTSSIRRHKVQTRLPSHYDAENLTLS